MNLNNLEKTTIIFLVMEPDHLSADNLLDNIILVI